MFRAYGDEGETVGVLIHGPVLRHSDRPVFLGRCEDTYPEMVSPNVRLQEATPRGVVAGFGLSASRDWREVLPGGPALEPARRGGCAERELRRVQPIARQAARLVGRDDRFASGQPNSYLSNREGCRSMPGTTAERRDTPNGLDPLRSEARSWQGGRRIEGGKRPISAVHP